MPKKSARLKILMLCIYVFILALIIFLADRNGTRYMLSFVGRIPYGDKLGHFFLMGGFSFLLNLVLDAKTTGLGNFRYLLGSLIAAAVVTAEEISQLFVGGRSFDWSDLVFDFFGIFLFGELARLVCRRSADS